MLQITTFALYNFKFRFSLRNTIYKLTWVEIHSNDQRLSKFKSVYKVVKRTYNHTKGIKFDHNDL